MHQRKKQKMKRLLLLSGLLSCSAVMAQAAPVAVQDFEKAAALPKVWVVNIPNENASTDLSTDSIFEGKQSLKLHYHFTAEGAGQYLGIPNKVNIQAPI